MRALAFILLLYVSNVSAQEWETRDKVLMGTAIGLTLMDWSQTHYIAKHQDQFHELNPVYGNPVSVGRVNSLMALRVLSLAVMSEFVPQFRTEILGVYCVYSFAIVGRNAHLGVGFSF